MIDQTEQDQQREHERLARIEAFGESLLRLRAEAIDARVASGIETIWREDEEHYEGVDDLNRGETDSNWSTKPPGRADPKRPGNRSTVFPNITRPYVDAASAKIGDTLLPTDDRSWSMSPTPVPELIELAQGKLPAPMKEGMDAMGVPPEVQQQAAQNEAGIAQKKIAEALAKCRKAEKRIEDWHVEGQFHAEMRRVIDDACKLGSGVLKGPTPALKRQTMYKDGAIVVQEEVKPVSKRIDPWNFFPAAGCGDSIHNGSYCWERDYLTKRKVEELKKDEEYIASQIDLCLDEGPKKATQVRKTADGKDVDDKDLFEVWYFHGYAEREDLETAGCKCPEGVSSFPAIVTFINDRPVKAVLAPLDNGELPYDVFPYQRKVGMPWGTGVSRQIRTPQQMVVAATRTLLTNAGRASGPLMIFKNNVVWADGTNEITPWKVGYASDDDSTDDARKLVSMIQFPDMSQSLMAIIQYALKLAEDVTGLPMLLQGQQGSAPDTLGGQQLAQNNASGVLRRIARTIDDTITEPHIRRYYAWLLQYGEDDEKGEFVIDARGSTALVDKELYKQELTQLLQASLNPAFELSPKKIMAETLRVNKRSPEDLQMDAQEKQALQQAQQKPQEQDNSVQVAQIRSQTEMGKAELNQKSDMEELKFKAQEAERQRAHDMQIANLQREIEMMKLAQSQNVSVAQIKADLAKEAARLRTQKELSGTNAASPSVEPRGRAPEGQAFQK